MAVIGDSTFIHSGITGLINSVYNHGQNPIIILDNATTAMTGGQHHPGTGKTLKMIDTHQLNLEELAKTLGVKHVKVIDPYNLQATETVIREFLKLESTSVIISRAPCLVACRVKFGKKFRIISKKCRNCGRCLKLGCPAIVKEKKQTIIDGQICTGCNLCFQVCPFGAIEKC
jgi:indolepyruvate ferredoxin oxidoreductase alpha subunit